MLPTRDVVGEGSEEFYDRGRYQAVGRARPKLPGGEPLVEAPREEGGVVLANGLKVHQGLADAVESYTEGQDEEHTDDQQPQRRLQEVEPAFLPLLLAWAKA